MPGMIERTERTDSDSEVSTDEESDEGMLEWEMDWEEEPKTCAATSQSEEEAKREKLGQADGSKPVQVPKRVWRPRVKTQHEEEEEMLDTSGDMDWLFEERGRVIAQNKNRKGLPERDDVLRCRPEKDAAELDKNAQWRDCPEWVRPVTRQMMETMWDVFAKEGMKRTTRGFEFHVDTGKMKPICCKVPTCGPHEERAMTKLVTEPQRKGLIEDDDGPWGSPAVLASKPNQGHVHWSEHVFRLCASHRTLNAVTRPFALPVRRCDDALEMIGEAKHVIAMDLDAGCWQMRTRDAISRAKTAFFTPRGKKRWKVTPMGATNAHLAFVAMAMEMEDEWNAKHEENRMKDEEAEELMTWMDEACKKRREEGTEKEKGEWKKGEQKPTWQNREEPSPESAVTVDDIILATANAQTLLFHFLCVLKVSQFYRVTVNVRKSRFSPRRAEFVGVDVLPEGNAPAVSKNEATKKLKRPKLFTDLRMLIGLLGFCRNWTPLHETRIAPWRRTLKQQPAPGTMSKEEETELLKQKWEADDRSEDERFAEHGETNDALLESLKHEMLDGPVLKRPDPNRRFYLKMDWSCMAQGAVLCQADVSEEAEKAAWEETEGNECQFDKKTEGLRLRPVCFIAQHRQEPSNRHSFVGEAATGRWAMLKFKKFLIGREFTWITDCSGLKKFFETDYEATHALQRWKLELLRFDFTTAHRPERMLTECNMLSRCNTWTSKWRKEEQSDPEEKPKGLFSACLNGRIEATCKECKEHCDEDEDMMKDLREAARQKETEMPMTNKNPKCTGPDAARKTLMAEAVDRSKTVWNIGCGGSLIEEAAENLGIRTLTTLKTEENEKWQEREDATDTKTWQRRMKNKSERGEAIEGPEWTIAQQHDKRGETEEETRMMLETAKRLNGKTAIITWTNPTKENRAERRTNMREPSEEMNWPMTEGRISNTFVGGATEAETECHAFTSFKAKEEMERKTMEEQEDAREEPGRSDQHLDEGDGRHEDCVRHCEVNREIMKKRPQKEHATCKGRIADGENEQHKTHDITRPAPNLRDEPDFLAEATDGITTQKVRMVRKHEALTLLGHETKNTEKEWRRTEEWQTTAERMVTTTPRQTWEQMFTTMLTAEQRSAERELKELCEQEEGQDTERGEASKTMIGRVINRLTTLPTPTDERWKRATEEDQDLTITVKADEEGRIAEKAEFNDKRHCKEWKEGRLEVEEGIACQFEEPRMMRVRQMRRRAVPRSLRHIIIAACHATPMAGHTGTCKTCWRIATRHCWPGMAKDVRTAVRDCGFCQVANASGHEGQHMHAGMPIDEPFDIICMDVWHPGKTVKDSKKFDKERCQKAVLASSCNLTAFASTAFINEIDADVAARLTFSHFFTPNGLPETVLIDAGSEFKGMLVTMCEMLGARCMPVPRESHNAILSERFHEHVNKVQTIMTAETQSYEQWKMGTLFATCAWNSAPIDGLDMTRSFAAKARTFRFPVDINNEGEVARMPQQGEDTLEHTETMFPLWCRQKELFEALQEERRERHRNLINDNRKERTFQQGDLVMLRRQVKSKEGKPAKLTLKPKGPHRVTNKTGTNSHEMQKIPATRGMRNRKGKARTETAARMTKIPSAAVMHKRADTMDTRLADRMAELSSNPLKQNLGLFDFGKHAKAPVEEDFAWAKTNEMWNEELDPNDSDSSDEEQNEDGAEKNDTNRETRKKSRKRQRREQPKTMMKRTKRAEDQCNEKSKKEEPTTATETKEHLQTLCRDCRASVDKLFFIEKTEVGQPRAEWHSVQIDWEETNHRAAKREGSCHCKFHIRNAHNMKRKTTQECRHWPLIREIKADGNFGATVMVKPMKAEDMLRRHPTTRGWCQLQINIAEDGLVGPFNFQANNTVHKTHWEAMRKEAETSNVNADDLDNMTPLEQTAKQQQQNQTNKRPHNEQKSLHETHQKEHGETKNRKEEKTHEKQMSMHEQQLTRMHMHEHGKRDEKKKQLTIRTAVT